MEKKKHNIKQIVLVIEVEECNEWVNNIYQGDWNELSASIEMDVKNVIDEYSGLKFKKINSSVINKP